MLFLHNFATIWLAKPERPPNHLNVCILFDFWWRWNLQVNSFIFRNVRKEGCFLPFWYAEMHSIPIQTSISLVNIIFSMNNFDLHLLIYIFYMLEVRTEWSSKTSFLAKSKISFNISCGPFIFSQLIHNVKGILNIIDQRLIPIPRSG